MRKIVFGVVFGAMISISSIAYGSDKIEAILFPAKFVFNNQTKELGSEYETFNYKGHAYVPVRFIAENMGGDVNYEEDSKTITVKYFDNNPVFSTVSSVKQEGDFKLSLHSEKKQYSEDEVIKIWASLSYLGERNIELGHSTPILRFIIRDAEGNYREEAHYDNLIWDNLSKFNEYRKNFNSDSIKFFNYQKSGEDYNTFINDFDKPESLRTGKYTIGVKVLFTLNDDENNPKVLSTDLDITVNE